MAQSKETKDYFKYCYRIGASEEEKTGRQGVYTLWTFCVPLDLQTTVVYAVSTYFPGEADQVKEMFRQLAGELGTTEELAFMDCTFGSRKMPDSIPFPLSRRMFSFTLIGPVMWNPQYLKGKLETGENTVPRPPKDDILWSLWLTLDKRTEVQYVVTLPPNSTTEDAATLFRQLAEELGTTEELTRLNDGSPRYSLTDGKLSGCRGRKHMLCSRRVFTRGVSGDKEVSDIQYLKSEVG